MAKLSPIDFIKEKLILLDQRKLPHEEVYIENHTIQDVYNSIKDMVVRGAPCIGFSGIFGIALWVKENNLEENALREACNYLISARPTAVNLAYEIERCFALVSGISDNKVAFNKIVNFGLEQIELSEKNNRQMAIFAKSELEEKLGKRPYRILTHCNTGYLACGSLGTALGVIHHLADHNLIETVWVDETRPYLQGSRLTAFELNKLGIHHKIIVEGAASYLMSKGLVDAIFVGADRITANGDTANKVGTNNLSILANYYDIPFYVVAPKSSFDISLTSGDDIEIELRPEEEILEFKGMRIAPNDSEAFNPSFDITHGKTITGIICEDELITPDYTKNIPRLFKNERTKSKY